MWDIELYERENGRCPCQEFLDNLSLIDELPYVERKIKLLKGLGYKLDRPHAAYLRDDIYELRIKTRNKNIRILYFFFERNRIVLTNGVIKKSDKTPDSEINKAILYRNNYLERER